MSTAARKRFLSPGCVFTPMALRCRYINAVQSRTMWPITFNGMLFNANRANNSGTGECIDARTWGEMAFWQNTRLPYHSMVRAGDADRLETIFRYYNNMVPYVSARTQKLWGHSGIAFHETKWLFGAWSNPPTPHNWSAWPGGVYWESDSGYTGKDYGGNAGGTEVAFMLMDAYEHTLNETLLEEYLPLAKLTVDFFRQHYLNRTAEGVLQVWPTQALETYWCEGWDNENSRPPADCCANDMPTVAALHALLEKMRRLPQRFSTNDERAQWSKLHAALPALRPR